MKTKPRPAHRILGRCLSGALGQTLAQSDLPATEAEWRNVLRRSCAHLVTPALRWAFWEEGRISELPADVLEFIDAVYALNLEGNRHYEDQLADLIRSLNSIGVRPVLLKGAAALVCGLYPTSGERMIADIDVLVPAPRLPEILDHLTARGYGVQSTEKELPDPNGFETRSHHYAPLDSPDWPVRVELHVHPVQLPFVQLLTSGEIFSDATPSLWRGGECLLPSPTHFILHNVIHAFLVNFVRGGAQLPQRQLFEFVRASQTYGERIDWNAVKTRFDAFGCRNALRQYIAFSHAYFCFNAPPEIDIDRWNRLRVKAHLFRLDLGHPAIEWVFALLINRRRYANSLGNNPSSMKKLLTKGFYYRLYISIIRTKQVNSI